VTKFQKKPVVVDAFQLNKSSPDVPSAFPAWLAAAGVAGLIEFDGKGRGVKIRTIGGTMLAEWGDWIIQGIKGELYPCKPDIFEATYKPASEVKVDPWAILEQLQGQIAAEIRVMLGEGPYDQKMFDDAQRQRRIKAMQECAANSTSDAERHESWMQMHIESGWTYGEEFDPENKKHPNLKPWDELPATTRSKARIFDFCAKAASRLSDL
jgi:hypothetical protein